MWKVGVAKQDKDSGRKGRLPAPTEPPGMRNEGRRKKWEVPWATSPELFRGEHMNVPFKQMLVERLG